MKSLPIYKKFLVSYALLVALPTVILASVVVVFFYSTFSEENLKLFNEALAQQVDAFDQGISALDKTTLSIGYNPALSKGVSTATVTNQMAAVTNLANYELANGMNALVHVMYFDNDCLITAQGTLREAYYLAKYATDELSPELIRYRLTQRDGPYIQALTAIPPRYSGTSYAYVAPLNGGVGGPDGCVLYLLQNRQIEKPLSNMQNLTHSPGFILNGNGELFALGEGVDPALAELATMSKQPRFDYEGQTHYLISRPSATTDLTFYAITNPYSLHPKFMLLMKIIGICLLVILLGASLLIWHFMRVNYKPIRILEERALAAQSSPAKNITLQSVVTNISDRLETLSSYYAESIDQRSNSMLLGLLTGSAGEQTKEFAGFFPESGCFAAAALLFDNLNAADKAALQGYVSDFVEVKCYPVDVLKKNSLAFIFTSDSNSPQLLHSAVLSLHSGIKKQLGGILTIGVGTWVDDPLEIYNSYLNALAALEARLIKGLDNVILFNEINPQASSTFQYPHLLVEQFKNALLSNNRDLIMESIDSIFTKIKNSDTAIITTRTFCYNIAQIAVKSLSGGGRQNQAQENLHTINRLMEAETVDMLAQNLKDICSVYLKTAKSDGAPGASHIQDMLCYIEQNCYNPDFSLQMLADHFKMSPSYVSRYFAAQNGGVTMIEYTNGLRMEKAKRLLRETDMPIFDIACEVAFLNLSSFNRKFKQMVGVPPGVYRQQSAARGDDSEAPD